VRKYRKGTDMAKDADQAKEVDIYKRPVANITELRIAAARIVNESGSDENPIAVLNALIEAECKAEMFRARYGADGQTLPASALQLLQDAARNANHRRTLARNLNKASGVPRPTGVEAHHIVSAHDVRAKGSRTIICDHGIGINDVDNGNYHPADPLIPVPGLGNAAPHRFIHTAMYHVNVFKRLLTVAPFAAEFVRAELRAIKADLVAGIFIY
jgi:hypothetical protein